ncbi:MAG: hypothetical protein AAF206_18145 [Bacteroidota bacterium]
MKSFFITLFLSLIFFSFTSSSLAQRFQPGQLTISPGVMVGGLGFYGGGSGLPLSVSGEYAVSDLIGVGPFVGFARYGYSTGFSSYNWTFINFGARGDLHYLRLLNELLDKEATSDKLDLYATLMLGFQTASFSGDAGSPLLGGFGNRATLGLAAGGRYYFTDKIAVFAEVGSLVFSALQAGVTIKLK